MPVRQFIILVILLSISVQRYERLAVASLCPNLTILLDTSGSMLENPAGPAGFKEPVVAQRKSSIAIDALKTLVTRYDGMLPIGLALFPSDGICGAADLNVAPALHTKQQIFDLLVKSAPTTFAPDTPTSASISNLAKMPALQYPLRGQYILLVTDGRPECSKGGEDVTTAVAALTKAASATVPIKTFVVGFGLLDSVSQMAMNQMADAGGVPTGDPMVHYFQATDSASLDAALDLIIRHLSNELGVCNDSCYGTGCPLGNKCIGSLCQKDPCAGITCASDQYCYTDGASPGTCVSVCAPKCAGATYCDRGQCIAALCGMPCGPGNTCDQATQMCKSDPLCAALPSTCTSPRGCIGGQCVDDPCANGYISCPLGSSCTPWIGTCQSDGTGNPPTNSDNGPTCSCRMLRAGSGSPLMALLAALGLAAMLTRRRRPHHQPGTSGPPNYPGLGG